MTVPSIVSHTESVEASCLEAECCWLAGIAPALSLLLSAHRPKYHSRDRPRPCGSRGNASLQLPDATCNPYYYDTLLLTDGKGPFAPPSVLAVSRTQRARSAVHVLRSSAPCGGSCSEQRQEEKEVLPLVSRCPCNQRIETAHDWSRTPRIVCCGRSAQKRLESVV